MDIKDTIKLYITTKSFSFWDWIILYAMLASSLIYSIFIFSGTMIPIDYSDVILPLKRINTFSEYLNGLRSGVIIDISPTRDFLIWLQLKLAYFLDIKNHRFIIIPTNFFIYISIVISTTKVISKHLSRSQLYFILCVLLCHPAVVRIIATDTWQKHLVATLFLVFAIKSFLKKDKFKATIFYLISILSVPIAIIVPFILMIIELTQTKKIFKTGKKYTELLGVSVIFGLLNIYYYSGSFIKESGVEKFIKRPVQEKLLSFGRYFYQTLIPNDFSNFYDPQSHEGFLGFLIGLVLIYLSLKITKNKKLLWTLWGFFISVPLVLNIKSTAIFYHDGYLVIPLLALIIIMGTFIQDSRQHKIFCTIIIVLLTCTAYRQAMIVKNPIHNLKMTYQNEGHCSSLQLLVIKLSRKKSKKQYLKYGREWVKKGCSYISRKNFFKLYDTKLTLFIEEDMFNINEKLKIIGNRQENSLIENSLLNSILHSQKKNVNGDFEKSLHIFIGEAAKYTDFSQAYKKMQISKYLDDYCFSETENVACQKYLALFYNFTTNN